MDERKESTGTNAISLSLKQNAFIKLLLTVDRLYRSHSAFMRDYGLSLKQYNILRILRGVGDSGLPVMDVRDRMIDKTPDVTRIIDRLIKQGLVKRRRQRSDRRIVKVTITERGLNFLDKLDGPVAADIDGLLSNLDDEELEELIRVLEKVDSSISDAGRVK